MMATYSGFSNKYNSSFSSIYNDRDSAIRGYESRMKQLYEMLNKSHVKAVDMKALIDLGVDKVSINTAAVQNPELISEASKKFGKEKKMRNQ